MESYSVTKVNSSPFFYTDVLAQVILTVNIEDELFQATLSLPQKEADMLAEELSSGMFHLKKGMDERFICQTVSKYTFLLKKKWIIIFQE